MDKYFNSLVVRETSEGGYSRGIEKKGFGDLPPGDVLIKVRYSALNYKDALSASGNRGVTKKYPHTPGIDSAGTVMETASPEFSPGEEVIVTSYDLGMNTSGGLAEYIRVPAAWVVKLPSGLSLKESMIFGTAGFTAGLSLTKLEAYGLKPENGEALVTGATGGVGSTAVSILAKAGYETVAVTGKKDREKFLFDLGAKSVMAREELDPSGDRPLLKGRWSGAIDTVGGGILAAVLKSIKYGGAVACCGLVASPELKTTVFPFIMRSVALFGVDSAECPMPQRKQVWEKLAGIWKSEQLGLICSEHTLEEVPALIDLILKGGLTGRAVISMPAD